jgi:hypothetical protein
MYSQHDSCVWHPIPTTRRVWSSRSDAGTPRAICAARSWAPAARFNWSVVPMDWTSRTACRALDSMTSSSSHGRSPPLPACPSTLRAASGRCQMGASARAVRAPELSGRGAGSHDCACRIRRRGLRACIRPHGWYLDPTGRIVRRHHGCPIGQRRTFIGGFLTAVITTPVFCCGIGSLSPDTCRSPPRT